MMRPPNATRLPALTLVALVLLAPGLLACAAAQDAPAGPQPAAAAPSDDVARAQADFERRLADVALILDVEGDVEAARAALLLLQADIARTLAHGDAAELLRRVAELGARLDAVLPTAEAADLVTTVLGAVAKNNMATLEQLGSRAVDVIGRELAKPEEARGPSPDTGQLLFVLLQLDQHRALALVVELERAGRPLRQELLFQTMVRAEVFEAWAYVPGRTPTLVEPGWIDVFARMLASREFVSHSNLWNGIQRTLRELTVHDALTPEIAEAFASYTRPDDAAFVRNTMGAFPTNVQWPSLRPLLERLVAHPNAKVRAGAADPLSAYRDSAALRALVDDPSAEVRVAVARLLRRKSVVTVTWLDRDGRDDKVGEWVAPEIDAQARHVVTRLLADPDPRVREEALQSAGTFEEPLAPEVYAPLVVDPDPGVRVRLAETVPARLPGAEDVLLALVRSSDATVVDAVVRRLGSRPSGGTPELLAGEALPRFLPVLSAVTALRGDGQPAVASCWNTVVQQPQGPVLVLGEAARTGDERLTDLVVSRWGNSLPATGIREVLGLETRVLTDVLRSIERRSRTVFTHLVEEARRGAPPEAVAALAALAEDEGLDPFVRLSAIGVVVAREGPGWEERLMRLLASEAVRTWRPEDGREAVTMELISRHLPADRRNRVLLSAMSGKALPDRLLLPLLWNFDGFAPGGEELTRAVLGRWHAAEGEAAEGAMYPAIRRAEAMVDRIDPDLLVATARGPHADVACLAIRAMGRSRDPVYLPTLRACLQTSWLPAERQGDVFAFAVRALTAYMDDEAARILLDGAAAAPDAHLRKECMDGVKAIQEYQRARAEWEQRAGTRATRDEAVAELVRMLDDGDATIRAESVRGLGLLGAVEHLPRVIRLLKDADDAVRAAAREALDRLDALEPAAAAPAPGGAGGTDGVDDDADG